MNRGLSPTASLPGASQPARSCAVAVSWKVLMALAQKARPRFKPHHPSRLLAPEAPAPSHQCVAPVKEEGGAPWSLALPHLSLEYGLSSCSACSFSAFVVDQACLPTSTSSPLSRDGFAHPCADLGSWEPSVWDLSLKARSLLREFGLGCAERVLGLGLT